MKIKDVKKIFPEATDEQIQQMLDAVHTETDALRNEKDKAIRDADAEGWKTKHDNLKAEYDKYKAEQDKKATEESKRSALKELIKDSFSPKGVERVLKYADLDGLELNDKGAIKDAAKHLSSMKEEWSDYVTETSSEGTNTHGAGAAGGSGSSGGTKMTRAEIMKITDPTERQQAIMNNPDAFRG